MCTWKPWRMSRFLQMKMKQLRQEKDREVKRVQADADKKERERALQEQKKIGLLEQKVRRSYQVPMLLS